MIVYWDTSALVPIFVLEEQTKLVRNWLKKHKEIPRFTSWLTLFEFEAVLKRKLNQNIIDLEDYESIQGQWSKFASSLNFINLDMRVARLGSRLQRLYALRPYDACHLGAMALMQLEYSEVRLACLDEKLSRIAFQEGVLAT